MNKIKNSLFYSVAIKIVILALLIFGLYEQINGKKDLNKILDSLYRKENAITIFILFILMMLNWSIESYKWKLLINKLTPISFFRSFKAVWTGVTLGMFTPNRIGEFGGRILYLRKNFRLKGIVVSLIGSFSTILVTIGVGIICLIIFAYHKLEINPFIFLALSSISILCGALIVLAYFNLELVVELFRKIKIFRRIRPYTEVLEEYSTAEYLKFILLSLFRYAVFTAQYLIFLRLFGIIIPVGEGITIIGAIYIVQAIVPTFALIELPMRGLIATSLLKYYSDSEFGPLAASTCMWLLNLIVPAVLGYFFIIKFNFFKNKNGS